MDRRNWRTSFPQNGQWYNPNGHQMTAADWENPITDAVIYTILDQNKKATLSISRSGRSIACEVATLTAV
jgi:hypothetical protein